MYVYITQGELIFNYKREGEVLAFSKLKSEEKQKVFTKCLSVLRLKEWHWKLRKKSKWTRQNLFFFFLNVCL